MAESQTLARPYAEAIFGLACEKGAVDAWLNQLSDLVSVTTEAQIAELISNPSVPADIVAGVVIATGGKAFSKEAQRLIETMAVNRRLSHLAEVKAQFEALRAEEERTIKAEVTSAAEMSAENKTAIKAILDQRWSADVDISYQVNPELIGGAIIKSRDWVIDGSIASQLRKLAAVIAQ
jgi:F-type H+-transporting ATPase subunit delta